MHENAHHKTVWTITKYASDEDFAKDMPYKQDKIYGNVLLNEGITALMNLLKGDAETAFSNANSYIGVGDSATAASASQTGLQAATNKAWAAMESTYPTDSAQTITFRSVFGTAAANYAWNEFTVGTSNDDSGDNLNRKVEAEGTKTAGQTWTVDVAITFS
jgi:hypothetical protein